MAKTEREHRQDIVEVGRLMYQKGWVAANDGNITVRLDAERILATPTGVSKGMMHPDDMIIVDMKGNKLEGRRERTSEILMHLTIYEKRADVRSVVHAHPPVATGFAAAGKPLNMALLPEVIIGLGCVPLAEYGLPGTPELTAPMLPYIPKYDAIMMGNHGAVCYGDDVWRAFFRMETVEHFARITLVAELVGGARALPKLEVDKLFDSRTRYGVKSRASAELGCPVVAEDLDGDRQQPRLPFPPGQQPPRGPRNVPSSFGEERFIVTREELIGLVDEALRARGGA
ncbi:MAG: class II aldolase/adducin family protein [Acidobacteria bacterium]|nr:class II aldolase/adducin family protein [Acidobacteriota bacterium]